MSVLVSFALFYTVTDTFFWDLPEDDLAAPASALCGWKSFTHTHSVHGRIPPRQNSPCGENS